MPEIATVEHLEAAIPEIATVERLEVPTAEAIMAEVARVEVQHQVVTVETVEAEIMEVLRRVQTPEAIAERLETVTMTMSEPEVDVGTGELRGSVTWRQHRNRWKWWSKFN